MDARENFLETVMMDVPVVDQAYDLGRDYWGPDSKGKLHFDGNGMNFSELRDGTDWKSLTTDEERKKFIEKFRMLEARIIQWKFEHLLNEHEYQFWKTSREIENIEYMEEKGGKACYVARDNMKILCSTDIFCLYCHNVHRLSSKIWTCTSVEGGVV
jgi:hypothetical protein